MSLLRTLLCTILFAICVFADDSNSTVSSNSTTSSNTTTPSNSTISCYTAIDATTSSSWVLADGTQYFKSAACSFSSTNFIQDSDTITLQTDGDTCEKAYIPDLTYGLINCGMKVSGTPGTVTSCMLESSSYAPYENVYFKFFGNDTTRVYIGFFSSGMVNQAGPITLKFDPTKDYHQYSIEYFQSYIRWYIDGNEVSSELGYRPIPLNCDRFTIGLVVEQPDYEGEDYFYPTDPNVNRVYSATKVTSAYFNNVTYIPMSGNACSGSDSVIPIGTTVTGGCDTRGPMTVFDDSEAPGWTISSTDSSNPANTNETYKTYSGTDSISFTPLHGDLVFTYNKAIYTDQFYGVEFWFNGDANGVLVSAYVILPGGSKSLAQPLSTIVKTGFTSGVWTRVVIPWTFFGYSLTAGTELMGFGFTFPDTTDYGFKVYIDGVYLVQLLPICANQSYVIYSSGLQNGAEDQSGVHVNVNSKTTSYNGTTSISWDILSFNYVKIQFGELVSTDDWAAISMRINFRNMTGTTWTMYLTSPDSTAEYMRAGAAPLQLFDYLGGVIPQGAYPKDDWPLIVIPFHDFGIGEGISLDHLVVASNLAGFQGTIYFDEIQFINDLNLGGSSGQSSTSNASVLSFSLLVVFFSSILYLFL